MTLITIDNIPGRADALTLAESGMLSEYLCTYFAQHLVPQRYQDGKDGQLGGETPEWLRYAFFMHYAEGSLMTILLLTLVMESESRVGYAAYA